MARTWKNEHHTDGMHIGWRIERESRPAGARAKAFYADLAADEDPDPRTEVRRTK